MKRLVCLLIVFLIAGSGFASDPDSARQADYFFDHAVGFYEPGDLDSALIYFQKAIDFKPDWPGAWQGKASTLSRMERHEEARAAYTKAIELNPNYKTAWWHRACDYAVTLEKDKALSDLRHAIALDSVYKKGALEDDCFQYLWHDEDFKKLVK